MSQPQARWNEFNSAITEFRSGCENLNEVFENAFGEVDELWNELLAKLAEFEELQRHHNTAADEWANSKREYEEALENSRQELQRVVGELQTQRQAAESAARENEELSQRLQNVQNERGQLEEALNAAQTTSPSRQELHTLRNEREELLLELEVVRTRAAELHEQIIEQQREFAERRAELVDEMRSMRGLLERQAELLSTDPRAATETVPAARPTPRSSKPQSNDAPSDAVVGAVMAQFSKLQQDRAKRRRAAR